jgi:membrane protein YqaA with SNARE-associated domain
LALIVLASQHPARGPFYALLSTVGSLLGCYVFYGIARAGGRLARGQSNSTKHRARRWLEENDFVAMLLASLLPPPAPLKVFVIAAGALRMNALRFGAALLVGRSLRFALEAWLGARYGARAESYLRKNLAWTSLVAILIVIGLTFLSRWLKGRRAAGLDNSG